MALQDDWVVGIDLGTTNSCVGVWRNDRVEILPSREGFRVTPSCVSFTENEVLVGVAATRKMMSNLENTVYDMKRLVGRRTTNENVQMLMRYWPFKVGSGELGRPFIEVRHKGQIVQKKAEDISAEVLKKMCDNAKLVLRCPVQKAVITVPAYFDQAQKAATIIAANKAGLKVLELITEPAAAAFAYGFDNKNCNECTLLVYDLGGGTFDCAIIKVKNGTFTVIGLGGDTNLGGRDIDNSLLAHFENKIKSTYNKDVAKDKKLRQKLRQKCEDLKVCLTSSSNESIYLGDLFADVDDDLLMSAATFSEICAPLFQKTIAITNKTMADAGLKPCDIDEVLLVGGSSRIPKIQEMLSDLFQNKKLNTSINLDEAVAYGAALRAAQLSKNAGSSGPNIFLVEATPLSLGIAISGDRFTPVIPQNSSMPSSKTVTVSSAKNNMSTAVIEVYEGLRPMTKDNTFLGRLTLHGLDPGPAGSAFVRINFDLNKNGLLKVTASHRDRIKTLELDYTIERENYQTIDDARYLAEHHKEQDTQKYVLVSEFVELDVGVEKARFKLTEPSLLTMAQKELVQNRCDVIEQYVKEKRASATIQEVKTLRTEFSEFCKIIFGVYL